MAVTATTFGLVSLPGEILLHILSFLEPYHITNLQLVSKAFRSLSRDDNFWRWRCFQRSGFLETVTQRRRHIDDFWLDWSLSLAESQPPDHTPNHAPETQKSREKERIRLMANWDPTYPSERKNWYGEYIHRHGSLSVNWFQQPRPEGNPQAHPIEARGLALYSPDQLHQDSDQQASTILALSPLEDGSVCLWDARGTRARQGAIIGRSAPGILFADGPGDDTNRRSRKIDSGVTECVSVDSQRHRAWFAVQNNLLEVDLHRLTVTSCQRLECSITTLSAASPSIPLTVGTNFGILLYDDRVQLSTSGEEGTDRVDYGFQEDYNHRYTSLAQPSPLSILHLPRPGQEANMSDDIYVAGRFSNILNYDRRSFPAIKGSIHSGASLCSLTSLPYPSSALDLELRRKGELSIEKVDASKQADGQTLIACGEYNTKGSLELFGLTSPFPGASNTPGALQKSAIKNRQTSSHSKLLSVVNHGTRIAVSDGSGQIKWFERDGFTLVRSSNIGDIARKLVPLASADSAATNNDLLFWTGERLGMVKFSGRRGFAADDFEEKLGADGTPEEQRRAEEERTHAQGMRRALEFEANNARLVRNLGL